MARASASLTPPADPAAAVELVEVRVWLPRPVAEWLTAQARVRYEGRSQFLRHLLMAYYLHTVHEKAA